MKNEAWKNLDAVKQNRVVILPPDLFGSISNKSYRSDGLYV